MSAASQTPKWFYVSGSRVYKMGKRMRYFPPQFFMPGSKGGVTKITAFNSKHRILNVKRTRFQTMVKVLVQD